MRTSPATDNRDLLIAAANELLQTRGFNAFSFRDLAERVGIKSSSVHYYFPTKQDLGQALLREYREAMRVALANLDTHPGVAERLQGLVTLFADTAAQDQWCLAGMLASDYATLDEPLRREVRSFFCLVEQWLAQQALAAAPRCDPASAQRLGRLAFALLEGALLSARVHGDPAQVTAAGALLVQWFESQARLV